MSEWQLPIKINPLPFPVSYADQLLLTGSCFTEHIGNQLATLKFPVLQNPNGILFDPASVAASLVSYTKPSAYTMDQLVEIDGLWHSWQHHSRFSGPDATEVLGNINTSLQTAHRFLKNAGWLIITLGTAYSYRLVDSGQPVANCHKAPARMFEKHLMTIEEINSALDNCLHQLFYFNPNLKILFTVSPVRHSRDGLPENNRSKARLIEAVHHLVNKFDRLYYFPAYELVIDVLRDYRFYDTDLVHPNATATRFVFEQFSQYCLSAEAQALLMEIQQIQQARHHRPFHPATAAHQQFLQTYLEKTKRLQQLHPSLSFSDELDYFSGNTARS